MFGTVKRRSFRTLIYVLVAAQALSFAPVATSMPAAHSADSSGMHCPDMAPAADDSKGCPCCPDANTVAACLSSCAATVGAISTFLLPVASSAHGAISVASFVPRGELADPPLKPPPIA